MTKPRRILIGTPLKGKLPAFYFTNILQLAMRKIPDVQFFYTILEGPAVQCARNELVGYGREQNVDELLFIDADLYTPPDAIIRLLSHDVPIVCGLYGKRTTNTHWHVAPWTKEEKEDTRGLLRVHQAAIGFSKIKMEVFDKIQANTPDRCGQSQEAGAKQKRLHEFFPMELMGPNTPLARINDLKSFIKEAHWATLTNHQIYHKLQAIIHQRNSGDNLFLGEDYGFCALARDAGIPIYLDTHLVIQHAGEVRLPIETKELLAMLNEPWRADDLKKLQERLWPEDFLRPPELCFDHCRDVLEGCYDVPVNVTKPTVLDLGANIGAFARWATQRWPDCFLHCYEPEKRNFDLLCRTIRELIKRHVGIWPHQQGVDAKNGMRPLYQPGRNCGEYSVIPFSKDNKPMGDVELIDAATLPDADIIKIDIEGLEMEVVPRLIESGKLAKTKAVMLEYHSYSFVEPLTNMMLAAGFKAHEYSPWSEHRGLLKFIR